MARKILPYVPALMLLLVVLTVNAAYYSAYRTSLVPAGYLQTDNGELQAADWSVPLVYDWNGDGTNDLLVGHNYTDAEGINHGYVSLYVKSSGDPPSLRGAGFIQTCVQSCLPIDVTAFG